MSCCRPKAACRGQRRTPSRQPDQIPVHVNGAHDLRTPLTTIFGFADMLLEDLELEDEVKREILSVIRAQSERLHRLIADLLDVERIEQGQSS
jgi:signal transduction histidine kinase